MRSVRTMEVVAARINADGSVAWSNAPIGCTKTATGTYQITFPTDFQPAAVTGAPRVGGGGRAFDTSPNPGVVMVMYTLVSNTNVLIDAPFQFVAVGT